MEEEFLKPFKKPLPPKEEVSSEIDKVINLSATHVDRGEEHKRITDERIRDISRGQNQSHREQSTEYLDQEKQDDKNDDDSETEKEYQQKRQENEQPEITKKDDKNQSRFSETTDDKKDVRNFGLNLAKIENSVRNLLGDNNVILSHGLAEPRAIPWDLIANDRGGIKYGHYFTNPKTIDLNFTRTDIYLFKAKEMVGRPMIEVIRKAIKENSAEYEFPGIEFAQFAKNSNKFFGGEYNFTLCIGTIIKQKDGPDVFGNWLIPLAYDNQKLKTFGITIGAISLNDLWTDEDQIVMIKRINKI